MQINPIFKITCVVCILIIFFFSVVDRINQASNINSRQNSLVKEMNQSRQDSGTKISQIHQKIREDLQSKRNTNNIEIITPNQTVNISQIQKQPVQNTTSSPNSSQPPVIR
jgi:predicted PurR-regulated permease PerM